MVFELSKEKEKNLVLMFTIVNRGAGEKVADLLRKEGVTVNLFTYGRGTASSEILEYLGLADTRREIVLSTMPYGVSKRLIKDINEKFRLVKPGKGIAFTIPISSICGKNSARLVEGLAEYGDDVSMDKTDYELIFIITNKGYADDVMASARSAKATGGTAIHAKGMGAKQAEKFFGITIQPEKEVILILAHMDVKNDIMRAVVAKHGVSKEAGSVVFSVPVSGVEGLPVGFVEE